MPINYAGVTPNLVIDTRDLQASEKLVPHAQDDGTTRLIADQGGVCASMVVDWIQKCHDTPGGVTDKAQLKGSWALSIAHTAYRRGAFGNYDPSDKEKGFVETHGLSVNAQTSIEKRWWTFKRSRYQRVAQACAGMVGYAYISIRGNGGHALGFRRTGGVVEFFDPNEGIMQFNSAQDFARWFPPYVINEYPNLLDTIIMI